VVVVVSACLLGLNTRYDGGNSLNRKLVQILKPFIVVPVCPEQLGGLGTPRPRSEILNGRVINEFGEDVTEYFKRGAFETLKVVRRVSPDLIILKSRSPSCGKYHIYDGSFTGKLVRGRGFTCSLLMEEGYVVYNEEEFLQLFS